MKTRLIVLALAALAVRAWPAGDFEFVVIGDTRPRFESENFQIFENLIAKINASTPAFVVNLGDLIYGYGPLSKERQWEKYQQVIQAIRAPYCQVPGNHDTYSKEARKIYARHFGKFYESFDYADCHFVLLDNNEEGRWGYMGPAEAEWLKADLKQTKARSVYVFFHFPVWEQERVEPKAHEFWVQTLHPLFRQFRVRAVFAGHFHAYGPTREFDGIRYYITGGGGAELRPDYRKSGGEHHFLKVKVSGDTHDLRVVTDRGELTDAEADVMGGFLFADKHSSRIGINRGSQDLRAGVTFSVSLNNPYPAFLSGKAEWELDASVFSVQPQTVLIRVPPGGTQDCTFTLKTLKDVVSLQSLPRLEFNVSSGGRRHRFHREVLFLREMKTPYRSAPLVLDGRLEDWRGVPPLRLGEGAKTDAEVRASHDRKTLFLAITVPTTKTGADEESVFHDDLQVGFARRFSNTDFGRDLIRLGFTCVGRAAEARDRTPGRKTGSTVPGVKSACRTEGDRRTYEIAVPAALLKPLKTGQASRLILNLSYPVPDGDAGDKEPADPSLNSFAYQVRYGGDSLVPVHFVELILDPKR